MDKLRFYYSKILVIFFVLVGIGSLILGCRLSGDGYDSDTYSTLQTSLSGKITGKSSSLSLKAANLAGVVGIAGAEVWIEDLASDPKFHTITDASGTYQFLNVPAGPHRIVSRYGNSANKAVLKNISDVITVVESTEPVQIPDLSLLEAKNVVTGQLRNADGSFLPFGTVLTLWGEIFKVGEDGFFTSPPLPESFSEAEIFVQLSNGRQPSSFSAPFVSDIVPVVVDFFIGANGSNGNNAPTVSIIAKKDNKIISKTFPGAQLEVFALASDKDASDVGRLTANWDRSLGALASGTSNLDVLWTAPDYACMATISVQVIDPQGAIGIGHLPIMVGIDNPSQIERNRPSVSLETAITETIDAKPFDVKITFSEEVSGFEIADVHVENGIAESITELTSGMIFSITVKPSELGDVVVGIPEDIARDKFGNKNTAAKSITVVNKEAEPVLATGKAIETFAFITPTSTGVIDESNKTVTLTVPFGTDVSALKAKLTVSASASAKIGEVVQVSEVSINNFSTPKTYTIVAEDGSTWEWTVTVTIAQPTQINSAIVTISAPVLGATPENASAVETATANDDYAVTGLTWNEALTSSGKFKAGQVYTATVTLTSKNNKRFQSEAFTPTVSASVSVGTTSTIDSKVGNTVEFIATFAATGNSTIASIEVTTQPTKLSYAEATDGTLALNSMVVTETYNDGSTNTINFTSGTAEGYTTSPVNGDALTNAANNGKPVAITHAASSKTANTNDLAVTAISEISVAGVTITAPVPGATPEDMASVEASTSHADYTVSALTWNEALTSGGKFKAGQAYTATVTLTSKNNKRFQSEAFTPTVSSAASVGTTTTTGSAIGNTVSFATTFAATGNSTVTSIEITTQPTKLSYAEATDGTLALNGMVIKEINNDGSTNTVTFANGTATGYTTNPANGVALTNAENHNKPVVVTHIASGKTANTSNLAVVAIAEISAAAVTITAPVLGVTPQDLAAVETATANADYTVTGLTWNEALTAGGKFKAGQVYTATVTLTSKNSKKFQSAAFTPTVSGSASVGTITTTGSAIGNTVSFTVTYASTGALAVSSIAVTTQPTKLSYAESTDGTLALNGMEVTETNNDGTTNTVNFTDGTAAGYTANPANGVALTNAANNGNPVAITHTASSQTANTSNLTVAAIAEIAAAAVTITAPVLGVTPENTATVEAATSNVDYTVTALAWNETLTAGGKFKAGQVYTATVTLTSKNSKKFQSSAFTPTVSGSASVGTTTTTGSAIGNTVTFTVTYAATGALAVSSIAVTTQPTKLSYAEATDGTLAINGMVITETSNDGTTNTVGFPSGTAAGYTTSPANGAALTNAANNGNQVAITHTASSQTANTSNLTVAAIAEIAAAAVTITAPVLGVTPENAATVEASTSNADYTVSALTWNEALTAGGKFKAGQVYTATVTLTSKNSKKFQSDAFTPTVAGSASVGTTTTTGSGIGNTVSFTVTYASTGALAVSSIAVTTQPTKLSYAEATDGTFALNGMVVTETNNDGTTNAVNFTSGTAVGYTTSPANGAALTNASNNAQPVVITHTTSTKTGNTSNLSVSAIVEISAAAVTLTAPVLGVSPQNAASVEVVTANADYTVTGLTWNETLTAGGKFKAGQVYTATITLTSKNSKKFQSSAFIPTVSGSASVGTTTTAGSAIGNTVSFTVTYASTGALAVSSIAVTTQPTKLSYAESTDGTLALNGMEVTETNNDGTTNTVNFPSGTAAGYTTSPANSTALTNAANNANPVVVTHTASSQTANTSNLTVTAIPEISAAVVTITAPVLGVTPENAATVEASTSNADYTVTALIWNEPLTAGGKFKAGQVYTATVTLTSKNNKKFQSSAFTPTVSGSASVGTTTTTGSGIGNTVSFTVTYASTGALVVTGISVTTQPTKLSYTEVTDDTLALNGMAVTETNNDGSTNIVTFSSGTVAGYISSPINGVTLNNPDNNWQVISVTHSSSGNSSNTNKVIVQSNLSISRDLTSPNIGTLKFVPAGTFQRDSTSANTSYVSAFRMSQHEITRAQYSAIMGSDPSNTTRSTGTDDPVQTVSWYSALVFCNKLSMNEGLTPVYTISGSTNPNDWGAVPTSPDAAWSAAICSWTANGYRLPTEMEWMWAAIGADQDSRLGAMSGGTNTTGYNKDFAGYNGSNLATDYAWYSDNSSYKTHPKGTRSANELGIHDMSGNVEEWCWDWHGATPAGSNSNYTGAVSGSHRLIHGGNWGDYAYSLRSAARSSWWPSFTGNIGFGFRVLSVR